MKKLKRRKKFLTPKQKKLCENYIKSNDEEQAYFASGYKGNGNHMPYVRQLFNKPEVKEYIQQLREKTYTDLSELNNKYQHFVKEYLRDFNAPRAYSVAISPLKGMSLSVAASQLLHTDQIKIALQKEMNARFERLDIDADKLVKLLWNIADNDPAELFDMSQSLKSIKKMPIEMRKTLNSFKIVEISSSGNKKPSKIKEVKLCSRERAIELLMKWKGMLIEKVDIKGKIDHRVQAGVMIVPGIMDEKEWRKMAECQKKHHSIMLDNGEAELNGAESIGTG